MPRHHPKNNRYSSPGALTDFFRSRPEPALRDLNNNPLVSYTRGNDLSGTMQGAGGVGGLLARSDGYSSGTFSDHNFYHADGNGNITYMVNSNQTLAASYRYDPYGNLISSSGSLAVSNTYRFSSKEYISSVALYCYMYRFYDPALQRWMNRDPIGELGGMNLYAFLENEPIDWFDPFGFDGTNNVPPPGLFDLTPILGPIYPTNPPNPAPTNSSSPPTATPPGNTNSPSPSSPPTSNCPAPTTFTLTSTNPINSSGFSVTYPQPSSFQGFVPGWVGNAINSNNGTYGIFGPYPPSGITNPPVAPKGTGGVAGFGVKQNHP